MANLNQQKVKERLLDAVAQDPELARGKKMCKIFGLVWVISRAIALVAEIAFVMKTKPETLSVANVVLFFIVAVFAWEIYNGVKALAALSILGGVLMTYQIFAAKIYLMLASTYIPIARIYALMFIIVSLIQFIAPLILLSLKPANAYFNTAKKISKEVLDKSKNYL